MLHRCCCCFLSCCPHYLHLPLLCRSSSPPLSYNNAINMRELDQNRLVEDTAYHRVSESVGSGSLRVAGGGCMRKLCKSHLAESGGPVV